MDEMDEQDRLKRAYVRILSLKETLDAEPQTERQFEECYVTDFHAALDHLQAIQIDVSEFRVPDDCLQQQFHGQDGEGRKYWSKERYVERAVLMSRIGAVLAYFTLDERKADIGFGRGRK